MCGGYCVECLADHHSPRTNTCTHARTSQPAFIYKLCPNPEYLVTFVATFPSFRAVLLLREPVQRAHSQYAMMLDGTASQKTLGCIQQGRFKQSNCRSIEAYISAEIRRPANNAPRNTLKDIFRRGLYHEQLRVLVHVLDPAQLLVVISERLFAHPREAYQRIFLFVGADPPPLDAEQSNYRENAHKVGLPKPALTLIAGHYRHPTDQLYGILGGSVPEWEAWYAANEAPPTNVSAELRSEGPVIVLDRG